MIICPKHKFLFVHIPKCAGTSIRLQLRDCDDSHIFLGRMAKHSVLGKIDYAHIPLAQLREQFPDEYSYFDTCDSFAMVRDPLARFGSALRQVMWQYEERPMTLIPKEEVRDMTLRTLDEIRGGLGDLSPRHIFFTPQRDYIYLDDRRIIDHVVPVGLFADLLGYFSKRTGVALDKDRHSNQNVEMRFKGIGAMAYEANAALRKSLPSGLHTKIKTAALKVLATKNNAAEASGVLDIPEVVEFVQEHYRKDAEIFQQATAGMAQLKADLTAGVLQSGRDA